MQKKPPPYLKPHPQGALLHVRIRPSGGKNAIAGIHGEKLKISLQAPPEKGKANQALLRLLRQILGLPTSQMQILQGKHSRQKTILLEGLNPQHVQQKLLPHLPST
ncbi:MAG: YggU family protein [Planctomycetota bacterium]|nr:MAG: YggU family protein [Planctomycetota bacterium]